jgi:DNA polymerase-3 subunit gamma/tau
VTAEGLAAEDGALHLIAKSADGAMRDGLSILDQVVSFGAGAVSAEDVRNVLGLISDDAYGELLRLVAERDSSAVFPLVERLVDAGADLSEFIAGAGETLRAVLLAGLGGEPEGLTEGMRALVPQYAAVLAPPDLVRLLAVLTELEPQLRASGNQRLAVELLLLRWAMMDRTVELAQVLRALGRAPSGGGDEGSEPGDAPVLRDAAPPMPPAPARPRLPLSAPAPPQRAPADAPRERGPLTLERVRALWPRIVEDARREKPMLGALLPAVELAAVDGTTLVVRTREPAHADGLERQRDALAHLVGRYVTAAVRITLAAAAGAAGPAPSRPRPTRLTQDGARAERLKTLRAQDPGLNAAVDALDLELLE